MVLCSTACAARVSYAYKERARMAQQISESITLCCNALSNYSLHKLFLYMNTLAYPNLAICANDHECRGVCFPAIFPPEAFDFYTGY